MKVVNVLDSKTSVVCRYEWIQRAIRSSQRRGFATATRYDCDKEQFCLHSFLEDCANCVTSTSIAAESLIESTNRC